MDVSALVTALLMPDFYQKSSYSFCCSQCYSLGSKILSLVGVQTVQWREAAYPYSEVAAINSTAKGFSLICLHSYDPCIMTCKIVLMQQGFLLCCIAEHQQLLQWPESAYAAPGAKPECYLPAGQHH